MKYRIIEIPRINYEVQDEKGILMYDDRGDNLFETRDEAENLIKILEKYAIGYKSKAPKRRNTND